MHDKNGSHLQVGDIVLIPARVKELQPTDDYCNVNLESIHGRRPDGVKETIYSINTAVTVLLERQ